MAVSINTLIAVLLYSIPMIISPGPGNTILATAGARFGVLGTLPFWLGFELANFFWCVVYGLGLSVFLALHPTANLVMKWLGVIYTLYLAYSFLKSSFTSTQSEVKSLTILDGFLSVSLNPKIHQMIFILFSQFLHQGDTYFQQAIEISIVFTILCFLCHAPWIYAGKLLFSSFKSERSKKVQGFVFAGSMVLVAVYVALS